MMAVVAPQPDGAEELALVERPVPRAGAGRGADQGRGGRRQPPRHPPAPRPLSAAAGSAGHPRARDCRARSSKPARGAEQLIGQKVCALVAGGGYAEYCVAPAGTCLPVPDALSLVEAAAMPETLFTVWVNLFERGFAADGDWVLVHGGTSGIGTMAIALGKLFGLQGDRHLRKRREMRPRARARRRSRDQLPRAGFRRGGPPADRRARASTSSSTWSAATMCRATCMRWPTTAATSRSPSSAAPRPRSPIPDVMRRRLTLTGSTLRPRSVEFKTMVADEIARTVWPYVEGGRLKPVIDSSYPAGRGRGRACADGSGRRMSARSCWRSAKSLSSLPERQSRITSRTKPAAPKGAALFISRSGESQWPSP